MPIFAIQCVCGDDTTFYHAHHYERDVEAGLFDREHILCHCGEVAERRNNIPAKPKNPLKSAIHIDQIGRTFKNAKELDKWAEENNKEVVVNSSPEWQEQKWHARQAAEDAAKEQGYRDVEHFKRDRKKDLQDAFEDAKKARGGENGNN